MNSSTLYFHDTTEESHESFDDKSSVDDQALSRTIRFKFAWHCIQFERNTSMPICPFCKLVCKLDRLESFHQKEVTRH